MDVCYIIHYPQETHYLMTIFLILIITS